MPVSATSSATNDLIIMSQIATALHEPLLLSGDEEDRTEHPDSTTNDDSNSNNQRFSWCDVILGWVVLPLLLLIQFYLAFSDDRNSLELSSLDYGTVNLSIALYCLTSWLFRHSCQDLGIEHTLWLVMPEIGMDIVLALVLWHRVVWAYLAILIVMLCLALWVACACIYILCTRRQSSTKSSTSRCCLDDDDEEENNDNPYACLYDSVLV